LARLVAYYGHDLSGVHLPFNFQLLFTAWNAAAVGALVEEYERVLPPGAWPNWVLGNHDQKRVASRIGPDQARIGAMLLLTLRGTPTLYYGDELGMSAPLMPCAMPGRKGSPGSAWGATLSALPCNGTLRRTPASAMQHRGFLSPTTTLRSMSRRREMSRAQCWCFTGG
jgi:glycosidase